ncbi:hypothetical protein CLI64_03055 [Nostoc sp. CENA543]|uniref:hypothetical protein n=1 Tax=Nostoc sp. CENA543 TaxID=1869241 RepID=UPI000CA1D3FE|nr:hypothetical protein [Nostoc sp. CENA543]AUS99453.1 hypothetical protein CLI64_03055 [Nostoc sp. CENA543]
MVAPELEQQLLHLSPDDKLYIIQILAQSLTTQNNNIHQLSKISELFRQSLAAELRGEFEISEYPQPQFYGCIQDETFFRHPQGQQTEREPIL